MSSSPLNLVSEQEYLRTAYRPDCDYIDGFVLERNLGQHEHSRLQFLIIMALGLHEKQWQIYVLPEQRLKLRTRKYRVPDIVVLSADAPRTPVVEQPPLLCIEIVSPDDRLPDLVIRAGDYLSFGVPVTWIFDPAAKRSFIYEVAGLRESGEPVLRCGRIELPIADLFAQL
jgi:Uma2 family endonuclease